MHSGNSFSNTLWTIQTIFEDFEKLTEQIIWILRVRALPLTDCWTWYFRGIHWLGLRRCTAALPLMHCECDKSQHMWWISLRYSSPIISAMFPSLHYTWCAVHSICCESLDKVLYHTCGSIWNAWKRLSSAKQKACVLRYHHIYFNTNTHRSRSFSLIHTHTRAHLTLRHSCARDQKITFLPYIRERPKKWMKENKSLILYGMHTHTIQAIKKEKETFIASVYEYECQDQYSHRKCSYGKAQHSTIAISATMVK